MSSFYNLFINIFVEIVEGEILRGLESRWWLLILSVAVVVLFVVLTLGRFELRQTKYSLFFSFPSLCSPFYFVYIDELLYFLRI